jgi:predicted nucleotidyltransferase
MSRKIKQPMPEKPTRLYLGGPVPMRVIKRYAHQVAEQFQPDKIILFGSQVYGEPGPDSDVDILVIMPARNQHDQAVKIRRAIAAPFAMDLLVRTPSNLAWRLKEGESFHTEILTRGITLYEKDDPRMGTKSRKRSSRGRPTRGQR